MTTYLPDYKKTFIRVNHTEMTAQEMAAALGIEDLDVYGYCNRMNLKPKPSPFYKTNRQSSTYKKTAYTRGNTGQPDQNRKPSNRPSAVYSNKNHWE